MSNIGEKAYARALDQSKNGPRIDQWLHVPGPTGWCLKAVRTCYGIDSLDFTPNNGHAPFAIEAFDHAEHAHHISDPTKIPAYVPVLWRSKVPGRAGHIAISGPRGLCASTDAKRGGWFDEVPIASIGPMWNMELVGWVEDLNRVRVYVPPVRPTRVTAIRNDIQDVIADPATGPIRRGQLKAMLTVGPKR